MTTERAQSFSSSSLTTVIIIILLENLENYHWTRPQFLIFIIFVKITIMKLTDWTGKRSGQKQATPTPVYKQQTAKKQQQQANNQHQ